VTILPRNESSTATTPHLKRTAEVGRRNGLGGNGNSRRATANGPLPRPRGRRPSDPDTVATILIERCPLLREGLLRILSTTQFQVVSFMTFGEDMPTLSAQASPRVMLIFEAGPDPKQLVAEVERHKKQYPSAWCVVLGDLYPPTELISVLHAGASAFLSKDVSADALVKTLELVIMGASVLPTNVTSAFGTQVVSANVDTPPDDARDANNVVDPVLHRLSTREIDTLYCLLHGDSNKLIARKFTIAEATVKVHIKAILRKIRVQNRTQAAIWAINRLPPPVASLRAQGQAGSILLNEAVPSV